MNALKKQLDNLSILIIYGFAFLLPIAFTPLTSEFYETAKFLLLSFVTLVLLTIWGTRLFIEGKLEVRKTPFDIFLILLLVTAIISTAQFFSDSPTRFVSLFGNLPKFYGSLTFLFVLVIFYFLTVFNLKNLKQVTTITNLMVSSGVILAIFSLLTYFKVHSNVPLIGSFTATSIYLSLLLPITLRMLFTKPALGILINIFFIVTIVLTGSFPAWLGVGFAVILTAYYCRKHLRKILPYILVLVIIPLLIGLLSFFPAFSNKTPLGKLGASFERPIQLPFMASWKISASAFRDSPLFGTGPSTYLYDFTQYKPIEINKTPLWNMRLSDAHNFYLQTWAELGGIGLLLMLSLVISFILFVSKNHDEQNSHKNGLFLSGLTFLFIMALSPMTILTQTAGFLILALAISSVEKKQDMEVSLGHNLHPLISILTFLPIIALSTLGFYFISKIAIGEYYHRQAIEATSQNQAVSVYNNLVKAEKANPYADSYRTDLAQINFALANAIASQKGPTEASPGGSLTDDDKKNIQQFLSQAITEGRSAVAIAPRSAADWEVLGSIYRQITGVAQNAPQFSLDAYGHAIKLDPFNPVLRLAVGGIYYQLKNYDLAIRFFDDAVSLKPDYSNALYNLAIALRDKDLFKEATVVAEKLVANLSSDTNSKDYQLAAKLLEELKDKAPTKAEATTETPSALEKKDLPKVINLPKPDNIATPEAVKK